MPKTIKTAARKMTKTSKVLIMCGGKGKRLGKITEKYPKPLIKIKDKSLLELKLERYIDQGFNDFVFHLFFCHS